MRRTSLSLVGILLQVAAAAAATPMSVSVDPEQFDYQDLPPRGSVQAVITETSPQFEFKTGRSRYAAFRLPRTDSRILLDVVSLLDPPEDPAKSRVFYPYLALLSDTFFVVRSTDGPSWRFDLPEYALTVAPGYRITVDVDPEGPERYLVVYTQSVSSDSPLPGATDHGRLLVRVTPIGAK